MADAGLSFAAKMSMPQTPQSGGGGTGELRGIFAGEIGMPSFQETLDSIDPKRGVVGAIPLLASSKSLLEAFRFTDIASLKLPGPEALGIAAGASLPPGLFASAPIVGKSAQSAGK